MTNNEDGGEENTSHNEEGEENTSRGNDWEVVSLTASTYAAAPGPEEVELHNHTYEEEAETSRALFMSHHFVFPPSEHENLPLEPDQIEIHNEQGGTDVVTELGAEEGGKSSGKDEENWNLKGLTEPDEFQGIQFFNKKGSSLSTGGSEFEEGTTLQGLNLGDIEQNIYDAAKYSSFQNETALGVSRSYVEDMGIPGLTESSEQGLDPGDISQLPKPSKDDNYDGSGLPYGTWWKRRAASLYSHAKDTSALWSIFVAAAVMGLVVLGQRWQQERWQALQLKWQVGLNNELC